MRIGDNKSLITT